MIHFFSRNYEVNPNQMHVGSKILIKLQNSNQKWLTIPNFRMTSNSWQSHSKLVPKLPPNSNWVINNELISFHPTDHRPSIVTLWYRGYKLRMFIWIKNFELRNSPVVYISYAIKWRHIYICNIENIGPKVQFYQQNFSLLNIFCKSQKVLISFRSFRNIVM
jgi:hypothetical protein